LQQVSGAATAALSVKAPGVHTGSDTAQCVKKAFGLIQNEGFFNKWRITGWNRCPLACHRLPESLPIQQSTNVPPLFIGFSASLFKYQSESKTLTK
jgi:hypothetical protein